MRGYLAPIAIRILATTAIATTAATPGVHAAGEPTPQPTVEVASALDGYNAEASAFLAPGQHQSAGSPLEYERLPIGLCMEQVDGLPVASICIGWDGTYATSTCTDGREGQHPLFRRRPGAPAGAPDADWQQVDSGGCPGDAGLVEVTAEEFRRLLVTPSTPQFQPADGRGLVNMELIVYVDPTPQILSTAVLGVPLTVRATPAEFAWDFGDGSDPLVTTDPGAPYPDFTVAHIYRDPGSYEVQLTTTWCGEYQINGQGPWLPVAGTVTTTSPPFAETVVEARSHLVADNLSG